MPLPVTSGIDLKKKESEKQIKFMDKGKEEIKIERDRSREKDIPMDKKDLIRNDKFDKEKDLKKDRDKKEDKEKEKKKEKYDDK